MNILRRLGLSLAALLFSLSIPVLALLVSIYFTIDQPQTIKQTIAASGIYNVVTQDILAQQADPTLSIPMNDPGVQHAFEQALPPTFLQNSSEQVIDGMYAWVHGTALSPAFSINLAPVKRTFADNIATYVQQKLDTLPTCTQQIVLPASLDGVLALTCMPRGASSATISGATRQEIINSKLLAENNTIDGTSLKDEQGRPIADRLSFIPQMHQYYLASLYVLPVLILLCGAAIIYWSTSKRAGVKRIAWLLITTGITSMILAALQVWLLHAGVGLLGTPISGPPALQDKVLFILDALATLVRTWWFSFGAGYLLAGIVILIILRLNRPKPTLTMGGDHKSNDVPIDSIPINK
ncbi:MAG TPA: hypothetical protein VK502_03035 [Candidatus Saccharimonadales bacterium]|nr:hypothetical protein [Candidatus Saccharimonadales bacterium]